MSTIPHAPDGKSIARHLAIHPLRLGDIDADRTPFMLERGTVAVVLLEDRFGEVRGAHVWTDPAAPADRQAIALAAAQDALAEPASPRWMRCWRYNGPDHNGLWLLRIRVQGGELAAEHAGA